MTRFFLTSVLLCALTGSQLLDPARWAMASDTPIANAPQPSSALSEKADKELATLRQNPQEFRTLVTGVQIFLGRFGYGIGPYTGQLDQATKDALKAYQKKTGLAETAKPLRALLGEILKGSG